MTTQPVFNPQPSQPTPTLDRFFASIRRSSVTRPQNRVVAGVCSGLAYRLGVAPAIVRVAAVLAVLLGPGVFLYLGAWLVLPKYDGTIRLERAVRDGDASSIVLLVATVLAVVPGFVGHAHLGPFPFIALAVLALVGFKKSWFGQRQQQSTPSSQPSGPQDAPRV